MLRPEKGTVAWGAVHHAMVEPPMVRYDAENYHHLSNGNKVSVRSFTCKKSFGEVFNQGNSIVQQGSIIRGDLAKITIGQYFTVGANSVIRPPYKNFKGYNWKAFKVYNKPPYLQDTIFFFLNGISLSPFLPSLRNLTFFPLTIGDYVMIDDDCIVEAASIGSYVYIGRNCVIVRISFFYETLLY
jgi:dynactin-5